MTTTELTQLLDFEFTQHCHITYKVTSNLYNSIDRFFYDYGLKKVEERRKHLLSFLEYSQAGRKHSDLQLGFGQKGLKPQIEEYLQDSFVVLYMMEDAAGLRSV